ncbi:MAG: LPXTG cell wall anchor domain-containing protein, partial [Eubacteriales bacterium]
AALSRDSGGGGAVFVVSSVYLAAHDALESDEYGNEAFLYSLLDNYAGATPPFGATMVVIGSYLLENLTMREAHLYTLLLVGVLPLAVAGAGVVVLRRRKNR